MTLHDKRHGDKISGALDTCFYYEKDVKEAVKKETELLGQLIRDEIDFNEFQIKRLKIFGEELIKWEVTE